MLFSIQAGQPELIALEKALKEAMVPAGTAREVMSLLILIIRMLVVFNTSIHINHL